MSAKMQELQSQMAALRQEILLLSAAPGAPRKVVPIESHNAKMAAGIPQRKSLFS
jgi:hypothetical protein